MAVQAYPYLVITDGTTTVTIQDGSGGATNYPLVRDGWAPAIAGLRASPLAGYTPYDDVTETLNIEINGSTAATALANLATLMRLLEQAARWYRGENETAVVLKFAPHGSTVSATATPLQAAILGGAVGGPGVRLSPRWDEVGRNYVLPQVTVSLVRRGLWLQAAETSATDTEANGDEIACVFSAGAQGTVSPTEVQLTNFGYGYVAASRIFNGGFLLLGEAVSAVVPFSIAPAEGGATGAYTSVAGGSNARNTNVLRYTPAVTTEVASAAIGVTLPSATDLVAVFANVRPSTQTSYVVRVRPSGAQLNESGPRITILADVADVPRWVFLGIFIKSGAVTNIQLLITASAAAQYLEIDTLVVCDARATQVLALISGAIDGGLAAVVINTLDINHNLLSDINPSALVSTTPVAYRGNSVFMTKAATVYGVLLATGGGSGSVGDEYRQADSGDAVYSNVWTLLRRPAYVVPQ